MTLTYDHRNDNHNPVISRSGVYSIEFAKKHLEIILTSLENKGFIQSSSTHLVNTIDIE